MTQLMLSAQQIVHLWEKYMPIIFYDIQSNCETFC